MEEEEEEDVWEESLNTVMTSVNFTHSITQHTSLWFRLKCCSAPLRGVLVPLSALLLPRGC